MSRLIQTEVDVQLRKAISVFARDSIFHEMTTINRYFLEKGGR